MAGRHRAVAARERPVGHPDFRPWPALWALCLGFFMILVDSTIVSVATPAIMRGLHADVNTVIWVTSAYLLAYAVPLLVTGRLGDRFGPRNVYLIGLAVFTVASAWCGLTGDIEHAHPGPRLPGPRRRADDAADHGRHHPDLPRQKRGQAMGLWGAVAGVATLVGPILGGVLVDAARLGVDLLRQRAGRPRRPRAGLAAGALPAHPQPPVRPARRGAERGRAVPAGLRHPGGPEVRLGHDHRSPLGLVADHRRAGGARGVRGLAGGQPRRAAAAAAAVQATATSPWPTSRSPRSGSPSRR